MNNGFKIGTIASKTYLDKAKEIRAVNVPIYQSTIFEFPSSNELGDYFQNNKGQVYTRFGHPTLELVAQKVAELEGTEKALLFSSGMAAITSSILAVIKPGDHIIAQREIFAQTFVFLNEILREWGVEIDFVDAKNAENIRKGIKRNTKLIYIESPSNPMLDIVDIRKISEIAKEHKARLFIDSTFATPALQRPIDFGVDLVIHSATKYLSGHSDVMCGVVAGSNELIEKVYNKQRIFGGILDPHAAYLLHRGLKTLHIRMSRISENALSIAEYLSEHSMVKNVRYPFLSGSMNYDVAKEQMTAGGGVVTFEMADLEMARKLLKNLKVINIATSLGGVESAIEVPYELDFSEDEIGKDSFEQSQVTPGFVRLSVGIEDIYDLINDLEQALRTIDIKA